MKFLQIKNSLNNKIIEIPADTNRKLKFYLCGPTVYDHTHIGNMRPSIVFDLMIRILNELEVSVHYVQNITDIDDKIIEKSQKENRTENSVALEYTKSYLDNFRILNLLTPNFHPITLHIEDIINFVNKMTKSGAAYIQEEGNVMFDIAKNKEKYGMLSKQLIAKLSREDGRKLDLVAKKNEKDFVVWKRTAAGLKWKLQSLEGRPGWHTECAAIIDRLFDGKTIDVHGGGKDLLFPHHENERIQYLSVNNQELSKVWVHFGHVNYQDAKMSKSLGNQISVKDFVQIHGAHVLKFLLINSNYNEDIFITEELIRQAETQIKKIDNVLKRISFFLVFNKHSASSYRKKDELVLQMLLNNLDTIKVFFALEESISFINKNIDTYNYSDNKLELEKNIARILFILKVTGFNFEIKDYNPEDFQLITDWKKSIVEKNFQKSDQLRLLLQNRNLL